MNVLELDREQLLALGVDMSVRVLDVNAIQRPEYIIYPQAHRLPDKGWYRRGKVYVNLPKNRLATKTPGYSWSFPGYKADLTPVGVVAHETGHHVDAHFSFPVLKDWSKEPRVTSYEPNRGEAFAEAFKLFVTNPNLLEVGRPIRWDYLTQTLGLVPVDVESWEDVLRQRGAHDKFIAAARSWVDSEAVGGIVIRLDQMPTVRDRVRQLLDETELVDPHDIADQIMNALHGPEVRSALAECLAQYVRLVLSDERYLGRLEPQGVTDNHEPTGSSRSTRWTSARSLLRRPYFVGEWRQFGDLTTADVAWLAEDRYQRAKNLTAAGDRFDALHDLMVRTEAEYVRDLPEDELVGIMR